MKKSEIIVNYCTQTGLDLEKANQLKDTIIATAEEMAEKDNIDLDNGDFTATYLIRALKLVVAENEQALA